MLIKLPLSDCYESNLLSNLEELGRGGGGEGEGRGREEGALISLFYLV